MPLTQTALLLLCALGLAASARMYARARLERRGALHEESVVRSPRARALFGISNAAFGLAYYLLLALASYFFGDHRVLALARLAALLAALFSLYLAYSLLFVTRASCRNCWTAHTVNWCLAALLLASF
ncbi:MAG: hypothetical protein KGM44_01975 [bacterium]|nr:hypothetical protein [bacterium]